MEFSDRSKRGRQDQPHFVLQVNLEDKELQFKRPNPSELEAWFDEYSLGEKHHCRGAALSEHDKVMELAI